ncbi:hypothetical protein Aduo_017887 [Ancylostoma duodenale]
MKATPELLLASLIESELVLNPYSGIETQLEKKATYMQSRVDKLHQYNQDANAGVALTKSQDEARSKLDEVIKHQDYVKHLITMVHRDHQTFDKAFKAADNLVATKLSSMRSKTIAQSNVYSEILKQLASPSCMEAFLSGSSGAVHLTENDLHALVRLRWAFSPCSEGFSSIEELEKRTAEAADVVAAILSETSVVVDKQTGLQGKDAFALLESIRSSSFFKDGHFLHCSSASESKESTLSTPPDSSEKELSTATESPLPTANEEGDRSFAEKPNAHTPGGTDSVDFSDHEDLKCIVNSVVTEELSTGKSTSVSGPTASAGCTEEHVESTNGSDSGNGTVTPSSDIQAAPPKPTKPVRGGRQFFKYRNSHYPRRVQDKESSQSANPEDRVPRNGNAMRGSGDGQQRRRGERQNRRGARANGFTPSNWNENDQRPRNNRPGAGRANVQPAASFRYEPGMGRRPAPTTCGIVFGGRA